jgi:hypothetical protein
MRTKLLVHLAITAAALFVTVPVQADPTVGPFYPRVFVQLTSFDNGVPDIFTSAGVGGCLTSSTGSGEAYCNPDGSIFAAVPGLGTATASADLSGSFELTSPDSEDHDYYARWGYELAGPVSTARGYTRESWTIGIVRADEPFFPVYESVHHECPPVGYSDCFNFYDFNYTEGVVTLAAGETYSLDWVLRINLLASATIPEPPTMPMFVCGLFFALYYFRRSNEGRYVFG